jgi:hypothetical protein
MIHQFLAPLAFQRRIPSKREKTVVDLGAEALLFP